MSDTLCQELKDCGFNSAAVETTQLNAGPTITNCQNHGIKPFLHVAGMEDSVATCQPYGNHPIGGTCKLKGAFGPLKGITSGSAGVLLSHLCKEGVDYLVIVNHPGAPGQSLTLEFSDYWQVVQTVLSSSGFPMGNPISQTTLSLNL